MSFSTRQLPTSKKVCVPAEGDWPVKPHGLQLMVL